MLEVGREGHDGGECTSESLCCVNCKGDHFSSSKTCPIWILEKEIQRVKAEKKLTYGEARRLVKASSPSPTPAPSSYANAVQSTQRKSIECQTPDFWMSDQPSLLSLSKKPSLETRSTGSITEKQSTPTNINKQTENVNKTSSQDHKITNLNKNLLQNLREL